MAIGSTAVWEVRTTGNDANGGFYTSGGTDYSQQDSAQLSVNDGVTNGTTTVTSATGGFTSAMIGNGINIAGAIYEITARASSTSITVDRAATSATGQTMKVGGALASIGMAMGFAVGRNKFWIKGTTGDNVTQAVYAITTASTNVSTGCVATSGKDGNNSSYTRSEGYGVTRGDRGTRPRLKLNASLSSAVIWNADHSNEQIINVEFDGNNNTSSIGLYLHGGGGLYALRCKATACATGFQFGNDIINVRECLATFCTIGFDLSSKARVWSCEASSCTSHGFRGQNYVAVIGCLSYSNGGAGFLSLGSDSNTFDSCTSYGNTSHGFSFGNDANGTVAANCLSYGNGGEDYSATGVIDGASLRNCAGGGSTSGTYNTTNLTNVTGFVTLTGNPFTNAAGGDFSLNSTAGAGAACRAAGVPGLFPGGTTTGYPDIGAVQHQDAGGGSTGAASSFFNNQSARRASTY